MIIQALYRRPHNTRDKVIKREDIVQRDKNNILRASDGRPEVYSDGMKYVAVTPPGEYEK